MSKLSSLAEKQTGSEIVKLGNAIADRIRNGEKIYNYTIGDFDPSIFPIPQQLEDFIVEEYRNKSTNYPAADGVLPLRNAIVQFLQQWEGLQYDANEVQVASGGRPLLYTIFKVLVDKGDKIIYAVPSWNNNHYVNMNDAVHCVINALPENNFMPTVQDIEPFIKGATLLCLCTPQNPTGTTLSKESLQQICNLVVQENESRAANEKKLYLMFDQMYWTLTFGKTEHYNPVSLNPKMKEYTIFVDGISKVFCATGVRVGWCVGPAPIMAKIKAILSHIGAWAPMAEQRATAKYLVQKEAITTFLNSYKNEIEERLVSIFNGFIQLKNKGFNVDAITPQAAIYLTIKIDLVGKKIADKVLQTQADVTEYILAEAKLAVVPFYAFGADKNSAWYRLSVGTCKKQEIPEMLTMLENALTKLN